MAQITDRQNQINFLLAGKAKFTLHNTRTGNSFSFKCSRSKRYRDTIHFYCQTELVTSLKHGGDANTTIFAYADNMNLRSSKTIRWYLDLLFNNKPIPPFVHLLHSGHCGKCGKELTDPESIKRGLGPICASRK